jgi:formate hydrogenlyase regulatory protein HycA
VAIPKLIPIAYEPNFYTRYVGRFGKGRQFMAFVVATLSKRKVKDPAKHKRWYAVLHTFDARGIHLGTEHWFAGTTAEGEKEVCERAQKKRLEMLEKLEPYELCNIKVKLFSTEIDGQLFGLVDSSEPEEGFEDRVTLWPNDFLFTAPWNGVYST